MEPPGLVGWAGKPEQPAPTGRRGKAEQLVPRQALGANLIDDRAE